MGEFRSPARYEAFVREGIGEGYRAEWHPGDREPFLGAEGFLERIVKEKKEVPSRRPMAMEVLCRQVAKTGGFTLEALRGHGRSALLVAARRRFIRRAILEEGYGAAKVAVFLGCHASNVSRVLQVAASEA